MRESCVRFFKTGPWLDHPDRFSGVTSFGATGDKAYLANIDNLQGPLPCLTTSRHLKREEGLGHRPGSAHATLTQYEM